MRCFTVSFETSPIVSHGTCLLRCIIQIPFFLFSVLEKQEVQPHSSASGRYDSTVPFTAGWKKTGSWCGDGWIVQVRARIEHCSERHICWYHRYQLVSTTRRSQMLMLVDGIAFIKKRLTLGPVGLRSRLFSQMNHSHALSAKGTTAKRSSKASQQFYKCGQASPQLVCVKFHQHRNKEIKTIKK